MEKLNSGATWGTASAPTGISEPLASRTPSTSQRIIRILRPTGAANLISAQVFDDSFTRNLSPELSFEKVDFANWFDTIFGRNELRPDDKSVHERFRTATQTFNFLCPNYRVIPATPLLLYVRNRSQSPIRLLLIAHAPGVYGLEWVLLRPLLKPGDLIIAPTRSAYEVINFLCPELASYTRIIPHPVRLKPPTRGDRSQHIVSLTRMHPAKLLHRQIEAMSVLHKRGIRKLSMRIAGPLKEPGTEDMTPYARSLAAKIRRLHLENYVELTGRIDGERHKARFLHDARLLVNLSVTVEESFSKAIAEALGCGVPVLATRWDGLPETVGSAGVCMPVTATKLGMDVPAEQIADAIERLLEEPPASETCKQEAERFEPERVGRQYRQELEVAMEDAPGSECMDTIEPTLPRAPTDGLLSNTSPLTQFSWEELFELHLRDVGIVRKRLTDVGNQDISEADELRSLLIMGTQLPLERFMSGMEVKELCRPVGVAQHYAYSHDDNQDPDFFSKIYRAATSRATKSSRIACLGLLAATKRSVMLHDGLQSLRTDGVHSWGVNYLEIEALRQDGEYERAFQMSIEPEEPDLWGELAAYRLRQLAEICRDWNLPGLALPWLREWLECFPDSPDSGMVWLDRSINAISTSSSLLEEARHALDSARLLLGTSVDFSEYESQMDQAT